jgi:hypothetical protein
VAAQAEEGSWKKAPRDAIVLGLKELPEDVRAPRNTRHTGQLFLIYDIYYLFIDEIVFICVLSSWNLSSPRGRNPSGRPDHAQARLLCARVQGPEGSREGPQAVHRPDSCRLPLPPLPSACFLASRLMHRHA